MKYEHLLVEDLRDAHQKLLRCLVSTDVTASGAKNTAASWSGLATMKIHRGPSFDYRVRNVWVFSQQG